MADKSKEQRLGFRSLQLKAGDWVSLPIPAAKELPDQIITHYNCEFSCNLDL